MLDLSRKTAGPFSPQRTARRAAIAATAVLVACMTASVGCGKNKEAAAPPTPPAAPQATGQSAAPAAPASSGIETLTPEQRAVVQQADAQGPAINAANNPVAPQGQ